MKFVHTLAVPEHIWMDFFRVFFSQHYLLRDDQGHVVENRFRFDEATLPENRPFDILFESDMTGANPNILPALVIEDSGTAQSGILLNQLRTWGLSPNVVRDRVDLMRSTYVMHCCARTRGESRLMASIVSGAVTAFRDALLQAGLHKVEPWSIGKSQPLKSDVDEVYVDTPVVVNFSFQEGWRTVEVYEHYFRGFCLNFSPDTSSSFIRSLMAVSDANVTRFLATDMVVEDVSVANFIASELSVIDSLSADEFVATSIDVVEPEYGSRFLRSSMRVS